jgi:hypothetical protein
LPWPLVLGVVAVALPVPVRGDASPGPAVVPVLPEPLEEVAPREGLLLAPPLAAPAER